MTRFAVALVAVLSLTAVALGDHRPRPNLAVTHLDGVPAAVRAGDGFTVRSRVKNRGSRLATHTRTGFFLQRRRGGLTLRVRLGDRRVPALQASHRFGGATTLRVPASVARGRWRLIACADRTGRARESNEGDNCRRARRATLVLPPATRPRPNPPAAVTLTEPATTAVGTRKPTIAGTADPRGAVTVLIYAGAMASGAPVQAFGLQPDANGAWSGTPPAALADGTYTVRARQGQGAASRVSGTRTFSVDATAPQVTIDVPADGATTDLMAFSGRAAPDESVVGLSLYRGPSTAGGPVEVHEVQAGDDGGWSYGWPPLTAGQYTLVAEQEDALGNRGSDAVTFTVPVTLLAAGDIAACDSSGDEATGALLALRAGTVALLGDNAYEEGSPSQYTDCYGPSWGPFLSRTRPAPGNREYRTAGAAGYFGYFGSLAGSPAAGYYSYDLGDWHVVALNTSNNCSPVACSAGSPQEQWLRQDLAAHPAQCTLAYFHHPQFSSYLGTNTAVRPLWQALQDFGADVVLNGHAHNYERFAPQTPTGGLDSVGGIRQFVVGTGGASHHAFPSTFDEHSEVHDATTFGVLDLSLGQSGYSWRFLPVAGGGFTDSGADNCH